MKLSINWLNDYLDLSSIPTETLVDRLTLATCEVEGVEQKFTFLKNVIAAKVISVVKHPDADRLSVCQVDAGDSKNLQIVCGAPNVKADMWVALAIIGAEIPLPDSTNLKIKPAKLRGVESHGMLCAATELQLDPFCKTTEGLLELDQLIPTSKLKPGTCLLDLLPLRDTILDIDNKSITHRPDLWCHFGFAKEIAAIFKLEIKYDPLADFISKNESDICFNEMNISYNEKLPAKEIIITEDSAHAYFGMALSNVKIVSAPIQMQARLLAVDSRPINNIVDASNYAMFELGQPNHIFDADTLKDKSIAVKTIGSEYELEKFTTLDNETYVLNKNAIMITDGNTASSKAVALAGIMGGDGTEVTTDTSNLFLESACFPREKIRRTISHTNLRTDSSQRFEKGQMPGKAKPTLYRLVQLIAQSNPEQKLSFGKASGQQVAEDKNNQIDLTLDFLQSRLGYEIKDNTVVDVLQRLGFIINKTNPKSNIHYSIIVPTYRSWYDVSIPEDIVEELGRIVGYDNIVPVAPQILLNTSSPNLERVLQNKLMQNLASLGYTECYNYSFASEENNSDFANPEHTSIQLANPVFGDRPFLRLSLIPGLLQQVVLNQDRFETVSIFEKGRIYYKTKEMQNSGDRLNPTDLAIEQKHITIATTVPTLDKKATDSDRLNHQFKYYQQVLQYISTTLGRHLQNIALGEISPENNIGLHPGCSASFVLGNNKDRQLGFAGLLHPLIKKKYQLKKDIVICQLDFDSITKAHLEVRRVSKYAPPSVFQDSNFELSLLIDKTMGSHIPIQIIENLNIPEISKIEFLTEFSGSSLPENKKSVSIKMTCQKQNETVSNEALQKMLDHCVTALGKQNIPLR